MSSASAGTEKHKRTIETGVPGKIKALQCAEDVERFQSKTSIYQKSLPMYVRANKFLWIAVPRIKATSWS